MPLWAWVRPTTCFLSQVDQIRVGSSDCLQGVAFVVALRPPIGTSLKRRKSCSSNAASERGGASIIICKVCGASAGLSSGRSRARWPFPWGVGCGLGGGGTKAHRGVAQWGSHRSKTGKMRFVLVLICVCVCKLNCALSIFFIKNVIGSLGSSFLWGYVGGKDKTE